MGYLEQVQSGVDFIETHLQQPLPLDQVARHAGMSRWHFQRIFKALTGDTLKSYIRGRRLSTAMEQLQHSNLRIIDIAANAGFESHESFTRAFRKAYGMAPQDYRRSGDNHQLVRKVNISRDYLQHIQSKVSREPELVTLGPFSLIGLQTRFYSVDSEKNNIGERLPGLWDAFLPIMQQLGHQPGADAYGVISQLGSDEEQLSYLAAVDSATVSKSIDSLVHRALPAATYALFTHKGYPMEVNSTVNYIYSNWLLRSDYRHTWGPDIEIYGSEYVASSPTSVIYYAVPVERNDG